MIPCQHGILVIGSLIKLNTPTPRSKQSNRSAMAINLRIHLYKAAREMIPCQHGILVIGSLIKLNTPTPRSKQSNRSAMAINLRIHLFKAAREMIPCQHGILVIGSLIKLNTPTPPPRAHPVTTISALAWQGLSGSLINSLIIFSGHNTNLDHILAATSSWPISTPWRWYKILRRHDNRHSDLVLHQAMQCVSSSDQIFMGKGRCNALLLSLSSSLFSTCKIADQSNERLKVYLSMALLSVVTVICLYWFQLD